VDPMTSATFSRPDSSSRTRDRDGRPHLIIIRVYLKPLLALSLTGLLSAGVAACGNANRDTNALSTQRATSSTPASTQEHIRENTPFDSDKDTDGAQPDEDDNGKPAPPDRDDDGDSTANALHDSDDSSILDFGHAAKASDRQQIEILVQRYYVAAAAADGAKACSLLYSPYAEAVPEDYGTSPPGPPYARGTTCPAVTTQVFKHFHTQIATRLPKLKTSRVRIKERQGLAVLSFATLSEREIRVIREGHTWKILALIDNELP
jgi:hypothetical protein